MQCKRLILSYSWKWKIGAQTNGHSESHSDAMDSYNSRIRAFQTRVHMLVNDPATVTTEQLLLLFIHWVSLQPRFWGRPWEFWAMDVVWERPLNLCWMIQYQWKATFYLFRGMACPHALTVWVIVTWRKVLGFFPATMSRRLGEVFGQIPERPKQ